MAVSRTEAMMSILKDLQASTADIEATAVVSVDGLIMASALPADVEEDRVAVMSAAMLSLGDRTASELGRGELEQVFINILLNAEQSTNKGGKVIVRTETQTLDQDDKKYALASFEDNGRGISEKDLARIFDPFFSTKEPGQGTGLGLSVSYGIIKAHSGDIRIKSKEGKGTTVIVSLPLKK